MAEENIRLNMGIKSGGENVWIETVEKERYIPDDHRHLFSFIKKDLQFGNDLIIQALKEKDSSLLAKTGEWLEMVHPYFAGPDNEDRRRSYINNTAACLIWRDYPDTAIQMMAALGLEGDDLLNREFWESDREYGTLISLTDCQLQTKRRIVLLLDDSDPVYSKVPLPVRAALFGQVEGDINAIPTIKQSEARYVLTVSESVRRGMNAAMDFDDDVAHAIYQSIDDFVNLGVLPDNLKSFLQTVSPNDVNLGFTEYDAHWLEQLIDLEVFFMLRDNVRLIKCQNCGRYMIKDGTETLCTIPDKDGTSCRSRKKRKKLDAEVKKIYATAYKTHFARMKNGKETKDYLDRWRAYATALQERVYGEQMSPGEYKDEISK